MAIKLSIFEETVIFPAKFVVTKLSSFLNKVGTLPAVFVTTKLGIVETIPTVFVATKLDIFNKTLGHFSWEFYRLFLRSSKQQIRNECSGSWLYFKGVPQGTLSGPLKVQWINEKNKNVVYVSQSVNSGGLAKMLFGRWSWPHFESKHRLLGLTEGRLHLHTGGQRTARPLNLQRLLFSLCQLWLWDISQTVRCHWCTVRLLWEKKVCFALIWVIKNPTHHHCTRLWLALRTLLNRMSF